MHTLQKGVRGQTCELVRLRTDSKARYQQESKIIGVAAISLFCISVPVGSFFLTSSMNNFVFLLNAVLTLSIKFF